MCDIEYSHVHLDGSGTLMPLMSLYAIEEPELYRKIEEELQETGVIPLKLLLGGMECSRHGAKACPTCMEETEESGIVNFMNLREG